MDHKQFLSAIAQIAEEKGISQEQIIETIEMAIAAAYKRDYGQRGQNIRVKFDSETGKIKVFQVFLVVNEDMLMEEPAESQPEADIQAVTPQSEGSGGEETDEKDEDKKIRFNSLKHMMIDDAKKIKKNIKPGEDVETELEAHTDFGRIAAQTAKQVIIQRLREAEREAVYEEYKDKEGEIVSGVVQRIEKENVFIDIGKTTGILFSDEQIPGENYRIGPVSYTHLTLPTSDLV